MNAAASAIFDKPRRESTALRDRAVLTAAAALERFTTDDVAKKAYGHDRRVPEYYQAAQKVLRLLWMEGHLRVVDGKRKPLIYEWSEP